YRHAYKRFLAGQLTLIPFVRRELWDIRQDRRELESFLRREQSLRAELGEDEAKSIAMHPSRFVNDADAIFAFLDEISRADEMRWATDSERERPAGNWIHTFSNFEEIVATLKHALGLSTRLRRRGLEANLQEELVSNIHRLLERDEDTGRLRSEEHTSELQSRENLVCRLLLEK